MANQFLKPEVIVNQGLGMLLRELVLVKLVTRKTSADFKGAKNDTIDVKIPSLLLAREYEWRTRTNPIEIDELVEQSIPLRLDKHIYSGVSITDEEMTLDVKNWGEDVARPQIRSLIDKSEMEVAAAMGGGDYAHTLQFVEGLIDDNDQVIPFWNTITRARKLLNRESVPGSGRILLLGADVEEAYLNEPESRKVDETGTDEALKEATISRRAGFTIIGNCPWIPGDTAFAFHPTAFAFPNVAPVVPDGVSKGAIASHEQISMRWIRDYDSAFLRDRSIYSMFEKALSIEDGRIMDPTDPDFGELTGKNVRCVKITFDSVSSG